MQEPPWKVSRLKGVLPPTPFPASRPGSKKVLEGIKVLELCRIIAGPTVTRILAEYGADVLKITSPNLSDVPFFQVDGNMGKHAADLDLKTEEGRRQFEELLADADVLVDGYRPGALDRLGYGADALALLAEKRGKGIVYVNENCFGYEGEWAYRAGWQQIADCVSSATITCTILTSIGNRASMGAGGIHGPRNTYSPTLPDLRLRHRLHGGDRRIDRLVPPSPNRRVLSRKGIPDALRLASLRRGPVSYGSAGEAAIQSAAGILQATSLRQRRPHLVDCSQNHADTLPTPLRCA